MNPVNLGKIETCVFQKRLILALDEKWMKMNANKPLIFDVKIENGKLVLEAQVSQ